MKCKDCKYDLGYRSGMHWPPWKNTCEKGKQPTINKKGELYNNKCFYAERRKIMKCMYCGKVNNYAPMYVVCEQKRKGAKRVQIGYCCDDCEKTHDVSLRTFTPKKGEKGKELLRQ